jgi:hypothetical protein
VTGFPEFPNTTLVHHYFFHRQDYGGSLFFSLFLKNHDDDFPKNKYTKRRANFFSDYDNTFFLQKIHHAGFIVFGWYAYFFQEDTSHWLYFSWKQCG